MGLNAGSLVHVVTVQSLTAGTDASGAPTLTPATLFTASMSRETERGGTGEQLKAGQESAAAVLRWTMRYHADMDPDLVDVQAARRLLYQGRAYDIVSAETIDRKVGIVIRTLSTSKVAA